MKGQILMDTMLMVITLSVMFFFITLMSGETLTTQSIRYRSQKHQLTTFTLLNDEIKEENINTEIGELLALQQIQGCSFNGVDTCGIVENRINETLKELNNNTHYIFYSNNSAYGYDLRLYDNQSSVCLKQVPIARTDIETEEGSFNIIYGTWFEWENPPKTC